MINEFKLSLIAYTKSLPGVASNLYLIGKYRVIDGNSIVSGKQHIRFSKMKVPELDELYGKRAKWILAELCEVKFILAYSNGETSFDGVVEKCLLPNDRDLAAEMVKTGLVLDTPHFTTTD